MKKLWLLPYRKLLIARYFGPLLLWLVFMNSKELNGQQETPIVTRVEEDWELVVMEAEPDLAAPQIVTYMMPNKLDQEFLFTFHINHATLPDEMMGGLQIQSWTSPTSFRYKLQVGSQKLSWNTEVITWTQRMSVSSGYLYYSIRDFQSASFGDYEYDNNLRMRISTAMTSLSNYTWEDSIKESGVTFAENRVHFLKLKRVRCYSSSGLIKEVQLDLDVQSK